MAQSTKFFLSGKSYEISIGRRDELLSKGKPNVVDSAALLKEYRDEIDISKAKYIDEGASGKVYQYHARNNEFVFAYKDISIEDNDYGDALDSAKREYSALIYQERKSHPHPNIVTVLEYVETTTIFRIFMEYCNGGTLRDYFQNREQDVLPKHPDDLVSIAYQINNALLFLHHGIFHDGFPGEDEDMASANWAYSDENPLLHRDLKPANILIIKDKKFVPFLIKVTDFGHSAFTGDIYLRDTSPPSTEYRGTDIYRAPEINDPPDGKVAWTPKCDMFSFGCILYELLHFKKPLTSPMMMNTPKISYRDEIRSHYGDEHERLLDMFEALLCRDSAKRYSARTVFAALMGEREHRIPIEHMFLSELWEIYDEEKDKNLSVRTKCRRVQYNIEKLPSCCREGGRGHRFTQF